MVRVVWCSRTMQAMTTTTTTTTTGGGTAASFADADAVGLERSPETAGHRRRRLVPGSSSATAVADADFDDAAVVAVLGGGGRRGGILARRGGDGGPISGAGSIVPGFVERTVRVADDAAAVGVDDIGVAVGGEGGGEDLVLDAGEEAVVDAAEDAVVDAAEDAVVIVVGGGGDVCVIGGRRPKRDVLDLHPLLAH